MGPNLWNQPDVPHKGWTIETVEDVREEAESQSQTEYETCQMCSQEQIRYVYTMSHPEFGRELRVGCICAEKMSEDYVTPKRLEADIKNKAARKSHWLGRKWRKSRKGNDFINLKGYNLTIFPNNKGWTYCLLNRRKEIKRYSIKEFRTSDEAKLALFEEYEKLSPRI